MARAKDSTLVRFDESEIKDFLNRTIKHAVQEVFEALLQAEAEELAQARPYERTTTRRDHRNGKRKRKLTTRVGEIELTVPRLRTIPFQSQIIDRYKRMECSLEEALIEMYLQGISTRKVAGITDELCGVHVTAGRMSRLNHKVYDKLKAWRQRPLQKSYRYLYLDGTVVKGRWSGHVEPISILVAVGVSAEGYREVLAVTAGSTEDAVSWLRLMRDLKKRGVRSVDLIVADAHAGLREARERCFTQADYQRCIFHFIRNILSKVPRRKQHQVARALKAIFAQESYDEAVTKARQFAQKHEHSLPQAVKVLRGGLEESLTYYRYPEKHWSRIRTNNPLERLLREVKRRLKVVGTFPDVESALMLATARLKWTQEHTWSQKRYLGMPEEVAEVMA
jgi:transposase-like protein